MSKVVVLTGGGTAGHVMPHFAIIPQLKALGWDYYYIGSKGIEQKLVTEKGVDFYPVQVGKLRRYLSWDNLVDIFRLILGFFQSMLILIKRRPYCVFSKGGYVSVPVCMAAWVLGIRVITHESDLTPGLATKIISKVATKVLCTFPETVNYLAPGAQWVGAAVRPEVLSGDRASGLSFIGFSEDDQRPVILFMGGSLGAQRINEALGEALPELTQRFRVVHLTGKGKQLSYSSEGYRSFEFLADRLPDVLAASDFVVSRAGANSIFEFLSLRIPMLLIPLVIGSRGDQVHNAQHFENNGWCMTLSEKSLSAVDLVRAVDQLASKKDQILAKQSEYRPEAAVQKILESITANT